MYARWVFSEQVSSASSERLFSLAGRVFSKTRSRQTPATVWQNTLLLRKKGKLQLRCYKALLDREQEELEV